MRELTSVMRYRLFQFHCDVGSVGETTRSRVRSVSTGCQESILSFVLFTLTFVLGLLDHAISWLLSRRLGRWIILDF